MSHNVTQANVFQMLELDAATCLEAMRENLPQPAGFFERLKASPAKGDLIPKLPWQGDPLYGFWSVQKRLLQKGQLVWSALIQANNNLFSPGKRTLPGEVVASFDSYFDSRPKALQRIADSIYSLKGTEPEDPKLRKVADRITDEYHRSLGERLPKKLTSGREVFRFTVIFYPKHLPNGFLNERILPLLVLKGSGHAMVLPHWYWAEELLEFWQPSPRQQLRFERRETRRRKGPAVRLSRAALEMIWTVIEDQAMDPERTFVRLRIDQYRVSLGFDQGREKDDHQIVIDGLTLLVDPETARSHWGSRIDFVDQGDVRGFTVDS